MNTIHKALLLQKRKWRIRQKIAGTAARPRLSVKFSGKHIYAQAINDDNATTVVFLSSVDPELRKQNLKANLAAYAQGFTNLLTATRHQFCPHCKGLGVITKEEVK